MEATKLKLAPKSGTRLTLKRAGTPEKPSVVTPVEPSASVPVLITELEYLTKKNPVLLDLIATLDLEEVSMVKYIADGPVLTKSTSEQPAEPLHEPATLLKQAEPVDINIDKLQVIALKALPTGNSYSLDEALIRIKQHTGVTQERAAKGLKLMVDNQIVDQSLDGVYYLFDSIPF